jgi:hypothetical protein
MNTPIKRGGGIKIAIVIITLLLLTPICIWGYRLISKEQINGKVLIVQKDADVKRLALIELYAVSASDVLTWKAAINESLRISVGEIHRLQKEALLAEAEIREIGEKRIANAAQCIDRTKEATEAARRIWLIDRKSEPLRKQFRELISKEPIPGSQELVKMSNDENWQDAYALLTTSSIPEAERINRLAESDYSKELTAHIDATRKKLVGMRDALDDLIPPSTVKALPADIEIYAKDVTDDTGSFILNVPPGDYYIFAEGNRAVSSKTEYYFWAHPIRVPSQESQKCLIGNLNLNGESTIKDDLWYELRMAIAEQKSILRP